MTAIELMLVICGYSALFLLFYLLIAFIVGTLKKNNGLMDIFYGPGYFVVALTSLIFYIILSNTVNIRQILTTILVFIWAFRLATYVFIRNRGKPEDFRYQTMRKRWKTNIVLKSLIRVYLFQGFVIFIIAFPVWFINISNNPPIINLLDFAGITLWLGIVVWLLGFIFETIGDYQLFEFKKDPNNKGKIMDRGLWKYTQHPNYFGEVTQWWGIFIITLAIPFGFISVVGPIFITYMIIKVSGIRLLNYRYKDDDKYAEYKKRTSVFFPWFPKKENNITGR
jgi:steroid 5-alpha reductase family enzyme